MTTDLVPAGITVFLGLAKKVFFFVAKNPFFFYKTPNIFFYKTPNIYFGKGYFFICTAFPGSGQSMVRVKKWVFVAGQKLRF